MQPIRHTRTARLRSLRMYREDLDDLVALFRTSCDRVVISDKQMRYDSLDEMRAHIGSKISDLDIRGESPAVHFLLKQREHPQGSSTPVVFNELRTEEVSEQAEILFLKFKEFLVSKQQPRVRISFLMVSVVAFFCAAVLQARYAVATGDSSRVTFGFLACFFAGIGAMVPALYFRDYLVLDRRIDSPTFFMRNREEFGRHAVTATISGIVGVLIGWLVGHYAR